jgi:RNA polymerase-binding transcription factor DksA
MNATSKRHFARRLAAERASLTAAVRDLERESALDVVEADPERLQMKDAATDAEVAEAATSLEMGRLREIDAALRRLRDHPESFGHCVICGHAIPESRLEMVPWTQRCSTHAAEQSQVLRAEIETLTKARD